MPTTAATFNKGTFHSEQGRDFTDLHTRPIEFPVRAIFAGSHRLHSYTYTPYLAYHLTEEY